MLIIVVLVRSCALPLISDYSLFSLSTSWISSNSTNHNEEPFEFNPYPHIDAAFFERVTSPCSQSIMDGAKDFAKMLNVTFESPKNTNCEYQGKVFIVGTQKTGTESLKKALTRMGYGCSRISRWAKGSCNQDWFGNWYLFLVFKVSVFTMP